MNMRFIAVLLLALASADVQSAQRADCAQLWKGVGPLREVKASVWRIPQIPDEGVVQGFWVRTLYLPDGERFLPRTVQESNCALDRMLDASVRAALRAGAAAFVKAPGDADPQSRWESLRAASDTRLNKLFVRGGMGADTGLSRIGSIIEEKFDIRRWETENVGALQRQAFAAGIYSPNLIILWLKISYFEHLGGRGFDGEKLVEVLRSYDASYAPPSTGAAGECPKGIEYRWPTVSAPIETHAGIDREESVHWGVCRSSGDVWVYYFRNGWSKATPSERATMCEEYGDEEEFRAVCMPKP